MLNLVYTDNSGNIFKDEAHCAAARSGDFTFLPADFEFIDVPGESKLFFIPDSKPLCFDKRDFSVKHFDKGLALSVFLPPGYLRLYLPAYIRNTQKRLPFYAYANVAIKGNVLKTSAIKIDDDTNWNPSHFDFTEEFVNITTPVASRFKNNRIVKQLCKCALQYHCTAAKNFFYGINEAPVPTSPHCNSKCLGCISLNSESLTAPHERLVFEPEVEEIVELSLFHADRASNALVSFGQGCEGDPIMVADIIAKAVKKIKMLRPELTVNFNSNCSKPDKLKKILDAGIDSVRVTIFSAEEELYNKYHRPAGYVFEDVLKSIELANSYNIFVSLNLLVFPGITDRRSQVEALEKLLATYRINLIQMRNLNIDPEYLLENIKLESDEILGLKNMLKRLKKNYKHLMFGYFNRPKSLFDKEIFHLNLK
jgi:pyruvate-formate lyase-activating enzyme